MASSIRQCGDSSPLWQGKGGEREAGPKGIGPTRMVHKTLNGHTSGD